jgi:hypothetical protein
MIELGKSLPNRGKNCQIKKKLCEKDYEINWDLTPNILNISSTPDAPNQRNAQNANDKKDLVEAAATDNNPPIKL